MDQRRRCYATSVAANRCKRQFAFGRRRNEAIEGGVWQGYVDDVGETDNGFFGVGAGNLAANSVGMQSVSGDGFLDAQFISSSSDASTNKIGRPLTDGLYTCGLIWNATSMKAFHSHGATFLKIDTPTLPAATFDTARIGRVREFYGYATKMRTKTLTFLKGNPTLRNAVDVFRATIGKGVLLGGQSNIAYATKNQVISAYTNGGETSAISTMGTYYS